MVSFSAVFSDVLGRIAYLFLREHQPEALKKVVVAELDKMEEHRWQIVQ